MVGYLGYSLAGHDGKKLYYVLKEDEKNVWLCDGETRTLSKPKKKNKKHFQIVKESRNLDLPIKNQVTDELIKRTVKLYYKDIQEVK